MDGEETESNKAPVFGVGKYMVAFGTNTSGSIQGNADFTTNAINLYDIASPQTNKNFSGVNFNNDGSVNISGTNAIGASGVGFGFQQTDFAFYKFNYTPSSSTGNLKITLGASELNRIANLSGASKGYAKTLPALDAGTTYEIVHGVDVLTDGVNTVNRIITKVGDSVYVEVDADNTVSFNKSGAPGALYKWFIIQNVEWSFHSGTISPSDSTTTYEEKTLLTRDLGEPATLSGATFDRNGGISEMSLGRNAGYNGNFKNTVIKFEANLTATGSMILQLRAEGTVYDSPWNSWTNKGYAVYLYSNGQTILTKNGATLCEGWSLSSTTLAVNTKHVIEFGTVNLTENVVRVFCNIDNSPVINYVDTSNPLNNAGWFTIYNNDGLNGSLMPYGVEYPQVTTDVASGDKAFTNKPVTLGYTLTTADPSDEVTYFIDQTKSTAEAEITDNQLVATTDGNVVVYACVNGIYSNDLIIEVAEPATPELTGVPTTIIFGQPNVSIDVKMSDDSEIITKAFYLTNGSGEATIDEATGEITPVKAGTINVYAIVNGVNTQEHTIIIVPVISIKSASIVKGQSTTLEYTANCDFPNEDISIVWEIVSGEEIATINAETGDVTPLKTDEFTVKVTLISEIFGEVSATKEFIVIAPVLINLPTDLVIVGGHIWTIDAKMSDDSQTITKEFVIENVSGEATINADGEITPVKAGTIKVYAIVNGANTDVYTITVQPVISITSTKIVIGQNVILEYTANCLLPNETISPEWEIVLGEAVATINAETGEVTPLKTGEFSVKVTLTSETFGEVSATINLNVIAPVLINLPTAPLIVEGEKWIIDAKMSDDSTVETIEFGITNLSGWATINADGEITPVKAGTVRVYAIVNGFKTEEHIIYITPKVFINKVGSFAFGGVYNLNDYYSANCEFPDEEITVLFEIVSGGEYATLDSTGILTVGNTPGIVGLKVYVTGETFQAVSAVTNIAVEKPIVIVQNSFLGDLFVGQKVTLEPSISQGGINVESAQIVAISGQDCVQIEGLTITAIKVGTFKYKIVVNNTLVNDDEGLEIAIENLVPTIIANNEMTINKTQQADIMFNTNNDYAYTSAVWSVISGQESITVSENGLITSIKEGKATIKVVIDDIFEATLEITVHRNVVLHGVSQGSKVLVGGSIQLSYKIEESVVGEVQTVEYVVVSGKDCVSLTADGKLEAIKSGTVKIKVVVNGIESQTISFDVFKNNSGENNNKVLWIIMGSCVGGALVIVGIVVGIVLSSKKAKYKKAEVVANEVNDTMTSEDDNSENK